MHYLGKLKRRMFRLHCRGETPPAPGTAIFNTALRNDESAGTVVRAEAAPDGGSDLLAVLHLDAVGSGELRLGALDGPRCERLPLPYGGGGGAARPGGRRGGARGGGGRPGGR